MADDNLNIYSELTAENPNSGCITFKNSNNTIAFKGFHQMSVFSISRDSDRKVI